MFQSLHLGWLCIVVPIFGLSGRRIPDPTYRLQSHLRCSLVGCKSHQMIWPVALFFRRQRWYRGFLTFQLTA